MRLLLPLSYIAFVTLTACQPSPETGSESLTIDLISSAGEDIGDVTITDAGDAGVTLAVTARKIAEGPHGIHFHVKADCQTPDFKSAGGHINPEGHKHGLDHPEGPDNADMPNAVADAQDNLSYAYTNERVTLVKRDNRPALLDADGSSLMIHINADDQITQPIGGAGARIACAEIK
ncbi:superoxide dismutase family protein [Hellea balneolensis]|uniref:superoxide dismutase family protein n=1 Tax=Hellea balneolensis TaxID=287478 RepID=UPI00040A9976|nr:superoxide dismutase family protein [Hellea balneolensis]